MVGLKHPTRILNSGDGICVQRSIVYVSACLALGYPSRLVVQLTQQIGTSFMFGLKITTKERGFMLIHQIKFGTAHRVTKAGAGEILGLRLKSTHSKTAHSKM